MSPSIRSLLGVSAAGALSFTVLAVSAASALAGIHSEPPVSVTLPPVAAVIVLLVVTASAPPPSVAVAASVAGEVPLLPQAPTLNSTTKGSSRCTLLIIRRLLGRSRLIPAIDPRRQSGLCYL